MNLIQATGISLTGRLQPTTLTIEHGSVIHILGENGAGKSSLLLLLGGVEKTESGEVQLNGVALEKYSPAALANERAILAQQVADAFSVAVSEYLSFYQSTAGALPQSVNNCLELAELMPRHVTQLSGGERQRVEIARTLLQVWPALKKGKGLLLLDEPFSSLDIRHRYALASLLKFLAAQGNSIILTSHDLNISANYSSELWLMRHGRIIAAGETASTLSSDNLSRTFGCKIQVSEHNHLKEIHVLEPVGTPDLW